MRKFSEDETKILVKILEDVGGNPIPTCIYARKSTKDTSENSIETQISSCREFANGHKNYFDVTGTFKDVEKSGMFTDNREDFLKIINLVEQNQVKVMIVTKWDRFSRDPVDLQIYTEHFYRNGGVIISVDDPIDLSAIGQLKFDIVAAFNKYYVHRIAEDTKAVLINKTSKGQSGGGIPNYGYQFDEDNYLVQNPLEAVVVADIFDKFELGYSYGDIIEDFKARNIKTRNNNDFTRSTIHDILENVKYKGVYRYNRQDRKQSQIVKKQFNEVWVEGGVKEPIVSGEQFDEVQKILKLRKGVKSDSEYMLSGVMECKLCGTKMSGSSQSTGNGKPRRRHYICPKHEKRAGATCANVGIDADLIETRVKEDVTKAINQFIKSDQFDKKYFIESLDSKKRLKASIQKSIDNIQNTIDRATDKILNPDTKDAQKNALERSVEKNTSEINELKCKLKLADDAISGYTKIFEKKQLVDIEPHELFQSPVLARQLIRVMVDRIHVDNEDIAIEMLEKK